MAFAFAMMAAGCAVAGEQAAVSEAALGQDPLAAGIREGSREEEGVLLLVNDRAVTAQTLHERAGLDPEAAGAIVGFRTGELGKARWFSSIDEIDALPATGRATFEGLLDDARGHGYVEGDDFEPPTRARLSVPDGLGRPPTSNDVTVEAGLDGRPPAEVVGVVRSRLTNDLHERNVRFVEETISRTHKSFTIAVGNLFATGSPHATFVKSLGADSLTMLGTMSAITPAVLASVKGGSTTYYARAISGRYEPVAPPRAPVVMRARVRLEPSGVRLFYPAWRARALEGPTATILEGG